MSGRGRVHIAVVGLGHIGASICAALRRARAPVKLTGIDPSAGARRRAPVDHSSSRIDAVSDADLVILATPVGTICRLLRGLPRRLKAGAVVTDVGSTKEEIIRSVPRGLRFVPGHPLAGHTRGGSDPDLFRGRSWFLLPGPGRERVEGMVRWTGARPVMLRSAADHDGLLAAVSHLPHLVACALVETAPRGAAAGGSFRDATRILESDPRMAAEFLASNRRLGPVARRFLSRIRGLLGLGAGALRRRWEAARRLRRSMELPGPV